MAAIINELSPHSYWLTELGKEPVTSQPEVKDLNLSRIFYMPLNNSTKLATQNIEIHILFNHLFNESGVSPVSKRYMRAGIGNDGLFVRISTLTYCIPYIFHVHDRIVVCFSNISAYFARNAESLTLITQESLRKSCSLAGGFVPTRSHRGGRARRYLVAIEF